MFALTMMLGVKARVIELLKGDVEIQRIQLWGLRRRLYGVEGAKLVQDSETAKFAILESMD